MLNFFLVYYFLGLKFSLYFLFANFILALVLRFHVKKRYYSPIKDPRKDSGTEGKDIHEIFRAFKRVDECPSFIRIYFGLISWVYLKSLLLGLTILNCYIITRIISLFPRGKKEFYKTKRFYYAMYVVRFTNWCLAKIAGVLMPKLVYNVEKTSAIYTKYLGSDFDYEREIQNKQYATVISNHLGWLDIFYLASITGGSFAAKKSVKGIPIVGHICDIMNTVWIERGQNANNKDAFEAINSRQEAIMKGDCLTKLVLFPEGTGTNNTGLIQFKKGAFYMLNPVKPYVIMVSGNGTPWETVYSNFQTPTGTDCDSEEFSVAAGGMKMIIHMALTFCHLYFTDWRVLDLPVITPNEYMFNTYALLGKDKVEVYMEVCRRIMSELSGLKLMDEMNFGEKLNYLSIMKGKEVKNT